MIGTTGLSTSEEEILAKAGEKARLVYAPNMSVAVNILFAITRQVASILDDDFDIEILEMHHRNQLMHPAERPSDWAGPLPRSARSILEQKRFCREKGKLVRETGRYRICHVTRR